jgi:hypothetical protein
MSTSLPSGRGCQQRSRPPGAVTRAATSPPRADGTPPLGSGSDRGPPLRVAASASHGPDAGASGPRERRWQEVSDRRAAGSHGPEYDPYGSVRPAGAAVRPVGASVRRAELRRSGLPDPRATAGASRGRARLTRSRSRGPPTPHTRHRWRSGSCLSRHRACRGRRQERPNAPACSTWNWARRASFHVEPMRGVLGRYPEGSAPPAGRGGSRFHVEP